MSNGPVNHMTPQANKGRILTKERQNLIDKIGVGRSRKAWGANEKWIKGERNTKESESKEEDTERDIKREEPQNERRRE